MKDSIRVSASLIEEVEKTEPFIELPVYLSFGHEDSNNLGVSQLSVLLDAIDYYQEHLKGKMANYEDAGASDTLNLKESLIELNELRDNLLHRVCKKIGSYADLLHGLKTKAKNSDDYTIP